MEKQSDERNRMSREFFVQFLKSDPEQYLQTPELNEILYLNYKGFGEILNLEQFPNVKCLYLEGNAFPRIQGLSKCLQLRSLYLHENLIEKI